LIPKGDAVARPVAKVLLERLVFIVNPEQDAQEPVAAA
jgi:hypothetical protein